MEAAEGVRGYVLFQQQRPQRSQRPQPAAPASGLTIGHIINDESEEIRDAI
jgi:hypothetical protein